MTKAQAAVHRESDKVRIIVLLSPAPKIGNGLPLLLPTHPTRWTASRAYSRVQNKYRRNQRRIARSGTRDVSPGRFGTCIGPPRLARGAPVDREAMDRPDYAGPIDTAPETELELAGPFAPRLRRAVLMLMAAIATHVWLVRAPGIEGPLAGLPADRGPAISQAGLSAPHGFAPGRESRKTNTAGVRVRTEFITLAPRDRRAGTRPITPIERPVGTSGLMRARAEILTGKTPLPSAPAAEALSPSNQLFNRAEPAAAPADVLARAEPTSDIPAAGRPKMLPPEDPTPTAAPAVVERAVEQKSPAAQKRADLADQEEIVRRVLLDYKRAYDQLDVQAAKAVWPSLDDRKLQRAFRQLDGQELRFAKCGVSVNGQDANARCQGDATYRPKVGSRVHLTEREWTFSLARANDRWQIVKASLQ